jgi:hypothetical protein
MHRYHKEKSLTSEDMTASPVRPAPSSVVKRAPTRFKVQDSVYKKRSTHNMPSVDAEFQKYVSDLISSEETDILSFWQVK